MGGLILGSIKADIEMKFDELWWGISKGLMYIIDALEKAFKFVVGASDSFIVDGETQSTNDLLTQTFTNLFDFEHGSIASAYVSMVLICIGLMSMFFIREIKQL